MSVVTFPIARFSVKIILRGRITSDISVFGLTINFEIVIVRCFRFSNISLYGIDRWKFIELQAKSVSELFNSRVGFITTIELKVFVPPSFPYFRNA